MCGIVGLWGAKDEQAVYQMREKLRHRGPDASGMHSFTSSVLGHQRLSIMDPEGGNQPILNENKTAAIVANGEIYNFPKLYKSLKQKHRFQSRSDSESVLHLYEDFNKRTVKQLDGMFAFAIADEEGLFLARDPIGIKPLYYSKHKTAEGKEVLSFASEMKALAEMGRPMREFPPGTCWDSKTGFHTYYTVPDRPVTERPLKLQIKIVRETLENAVTKRLMSDVPVGAFLSGGLDSSLLVALMRPHVDQLHTFSVGIEGSEDLQAARRVSGLLDTIHHEHIISLDEVLDSLPQVLYYLESFDQDLVRSAIPCYFCSRLASQYVKVVLTGEGADELFAGYTYYKDYGKNDNRLHSELRRSIESLYNINLQRVDRLTMAHGLEARVPFLDTNMIEASLTIPTELKIRYDSEERRVEKWILRKACEDLLPDDILWRVKAQFDEGSGVTELVQAITQKYGAGIDPVDYTRQHPEIKLRSLEECAYHKLFVDVHSRSDLLQGNVAQWSENRNGE